MKKTVKYLGSIIVAIIIIFLLIGCGEQKDTDAGNQKEIINSDENMNTDTGINDANDNGANQEQNGNSDDEVDLPKVPIP